MAEASAPGVNLRIPRGHRRGLIVLHVVSSVGLLGHTGGLVVLSCSAAVAQDPAIDAVVYPIMTRSVHLLGIPLALLALATGVLLSLSSQWGLLRHTWIVAKLVLLLASIAVGVLGVREWLGVLASPPGPPMDPSYPDPAWLLVGGGAGQVTMLVVATALSVWKPRGRPRRPGRAATSATSAR